MDYLDRFTTMERLSMETNPTYGAVIKYDDRVFATDIHWKGYYTARVYEFVETPEETGLGDIECRLSLIAEAKETFEDSGHAIEWCLRQR